MPDESKLEKVVKALAAAYEAESEVESVRESAKAAVAEAQETKEKRILDLVKIMGLNPGNYSVMDAMGKAERMVIDAALEHVRG